MLTKDRDKATNVFTKVIVGRDYFGDGSSVEDEGQGKDKDKGKGEGKGLGKGRGRGGGQHLDDTT